MFWLTYVTVNIQNVFLWLECAWRRLRLWSMESSVTLCFTPTHTSIRYCFMSFTSCAFSSRLAAPDYVMKCTEVRAVRLPEIWNFIPVSCVIALSDWRQSRRSRIYQQEAQLMLTNPHDAFRGQSRSPNIAPFHMLGIVSLLCNSNFVFKTRDIRLQKCRDLENWVMGPSRSLEISPFDRAQTTSY